MNILIVEDNEQMRRVVKCVVADLVECIYECGDGREALSLYKRHLPDCVLMDIKMPKSDGISATRQIKDAFPEAHITIVTNYDDPALREKARLAGACEYLVKEDLLKLRQILIREKAEVEKEIKQ
jgi:CheY-like chemotaxis protein